MDSKKDETRGRVVATRVFQTETGSEVVATICEPVMIGPDEWTCNFQISGLSREVQAHGSGVDGMQALIVALQGVRVHLEGAAEILSMLDGEPGDFGIPRSIPDGYGPEVEKHLARVLTDEVTRLVEAKWRSKGGP